MHPWVSGRGGALGEWVGFGIPLGEWVGPSAPLGVKCGALGEWAASWGPPWTVNTQLPDS